MTKLGIRRRSYLPNTGGASGISEARRLLIPGPSARSQHNTLHGPALAPEGRYCS